MIHLELLPESPVEGRRLGRHLEHDDRSRHFAFAARPSRPLISRAWKRHAPVFDQGALGKCTAEAAIGCAMTEPIFRPGARVLGDADAMLLYEEATRLDRIPGQYPPDDTGSSGLAAAKAAKRAGYFAGYSHAFSAAAALDALAHVGPIMLGIKWWTGDDNPRGALALLEGGGVVRGGHEIEATEIDVIRKIIRGPNSWGPAWGAEGWWAMTFDELARRLRDQGDCVIPRGD